ncbi:hypothetical protein QN277_026910 [Acacia crassicarpa]|uniref:Uncharacterized protein n=1 Tax=Acacia crassicarpa TaxID=499986 RepID=A0AAE1JAA0_9FABA|nr:hypothetical protein QN277_026910 [Acacia crassicarpa]
MPSWQLSARHFFHPLASSRFHSTEHGTPCYSFGFKIWLFEGIKVIDLPGKHCKLSAFPSLFILGITFELLEI